MITDSNVGAGLPPGDYDFAGRRHGSRSRPATPRESTTPARRLHGALAGSALTMDRGMANLLAWLDLPEEQVWAMGSRNPARLLGLAGKGTLAVGADADLVLWDQIGGQHCVARAHVGCAAACVYESTELAFHSIEEQYR